MYILEQKSENNVYPCKPQFYYIKVGCKGVFITQTCFRDESDPRFAPSIPEDHWSYKHSSGSRKEDF